MTQSKRIFLNVVATYGRSLFSLALGIFSGRWVLMAMGEADYGLYGLVGGLTFFITFVNQLLSASDCRFFAVAIGESHSAEGRSDGIENCRRWFSTAVFIHTVIPVLLVAVGYPAGVWAVESFLSIPPERVEACLWVWRFTCLSCFVGMVGAPFSAMYIAKQFIAELTIYEIARTAVNFLLIYYMASHPSDWLVKYAMWTCVIGMAPTFLICLRALAVFPECKVRIAYMYSPKHLRELGRFSGWQMLSGMGLLLRGQGLSIIVNKFFGSRVNASVSYANMVKGQLSALSGSLKGAFMPAIAQAYGKGDTAMLQRMSYISCKLCTLLVLAFALPVAFELRFLLKVWLVKPPPHVDMLCLYFLGAVVADHLTIGHILAVNASGRIAMSQVLECAGLVLFIPVSIMLCGSGAGVSGVGIAFIASQLFMSAGRIFVAERTVGMSFACWLKDILLPVAVISAAGISIGYGVSAAMEESWMRIFVSAGCVGGVFAALSWLLVFNRGERDFLLNLLRSRLPFLKGK